MDAAAGERFLRDEFEQLARPTSWADAADRLRGFTRRNGFDHALHLTLTSDRQRGGGSIFVSTCPREWIERHLTRTDRAIDPIRSEARRNAQPFEWERLAEIGDAARVFLDEARAAGVGRHGLSIPIHGPNGEAAVFSVTSSESDDDWSARIRALMPYLQILGFEFHRGIAALAETPPAPCDPASRLSPRERDVLHWAAAGKTVWETGRLLGLSELTTQSYIRDAVKRLGAINKTHAVAEAVRLGLI